MLKVTKDELRFMDTSSTPHFLGLDGPDGLWDRVGGVRDAGEGIVIGDIDSGIWPENRSFSNRDDDDHGRRHDFDDDDRPRLRIVMASTTFMARVCSASSSAVPIATGKIDRRAAASTRRWAAMRGIEGAAAVEFASARDYNGHGTHTAATAAGNNGVADERRRVDLRPRCSGMAPHARIAVL